MPFLEILCIYMECVTDVLSCSTYSFVGTAVIQPVETTLTKWHYSSLQNF